MNLIPHRPDGLDPDENPATLIVDGEIEEQHQHSLVRLARWRAAEIAERIFGVPLDHRLLGTSGSAGFRGMLEFEVVFDELESHQGREATFVAAVRRDEFLSRVPLVYIFTPTVPAPSDPPAEVSRAG